MKAILICPRDRPAVPHLADMGSLAMLPILGDRLVNHWIEHLAMLGATTIDIIAPKCAGQVAQATGDGARWGVTLNILESNLEPTVEEAVRQCPDCGASGWLTAPFDVVTMDHLPGQDHLPLFDSYSCWFAALLAWIPRSMTATRIRVSEVSPGVWIGSRAKVSPSAQLVAPCWIGDHSIVEAGAVVGPEAILEDRVVVDSKARVTHSWVGPDTFVGQMTHVGHSLAVGPMLIDWQSDSSLHVPDPFLLSSLTRNSPAVGQARSSRAFGIRVERSMGFLATLRSILSRS
jgi:NDP-sugar pyrophosphorylase family protein